MSSAQLGTDRGMSVGAVLHYGTPLSPQPCGPESMRHGTCRRIDPPPSFGWQLSIRRLVARRTSRQLCAEFRAFHVPNQPSVLPAARAPPQLCQSMADSRDLRPVPTRHRGVEGLLQLPLCVTVRAGQPQPRTPRREGGHVHVPERLREAAHDVRDPRGPGPLPVQQRRGPGPTERQQPCEPPTRQDAVRHVTHLRRQQSGWGHGPLLCLEGSCRTDNPRPLPSH